MAKLERRTIRHSEAIHEHASAKTKQSMISGEINMSKAC